MILTLVKQFSKQVLDPRPVFEESIVRIKFGLIGALTAGLLSTVGIALFILALYLWLLERGLTQIMSLLVAGGAFVVGAAIVLALSNWFARREIKSNKRKTELERETVSNEPIDPAVEQLKATAVAIAQAAAEGLLEGLTTEKPVKSTSPETENPPA